MLKKMIKAMQKMMPGLRKIFLATVVLVSVLVVVIVIRLATLPTRPSVPNAIFPEGQPAPDAGGGATIENETPVDSLAILYIQDGDLWQDDGSGDNRIKLIDRDTIIGAEASPDGRNIAYAMQTTKTETVKTFEGVEETRDFARNNLMLSDGKGADSYLVKEGVADWGWIASTGLLWYESDVLTQFFDWGYYGNEDIWIFDPANKTATQLAQDVEMLNPAWSPDGNKVSYIGYKLDASGNYAGLVVKVVDRPRGETKQLFDVPYVGGDRGGPPPVPTLYWNGSSDALYTAFTPLLWAGDLYGGKFTSGYLTAWKIPVDGSEAVRLMPDVPSAVMNDETRPRVIFNDDFSKMIYRRVKEADIAGKEPYQWFYADQVPVSLAVYDFAAKEEKILINNLDMISPATFLADDVLFAITKESGADGKTKEVVVRRFELGSGGVQEFRTEDYAQQYGVAALAYLESKQLFYFRLDSAADKYSFDSVVVLDESSGKFETVLDQVANQMDVQSEAGSLR